MQLRVRATHQQRRRLGVVSPPLQHILAASAASVPSTINHRPGAGSCLSCPRLSGRAQARAVAASQPHIRRVCYAHRRSVVSGFLFHVLDRPWVLSPRVSVGDAGLRLYQARLALQHSWVHFNDRYLVPSGAQHGVLVPEWARTPATRAHVNVHAYTDANISCSSLGSSVPHLRRDWAHP